MSEPAVEKTVYQEALEAAYAREPKDVHAWLRETRQSAFERFHELKFPTKKDEAWKYANLNPLLHTSFVTATKEKMAAVDEHYLIPYFLKGKSHRLTFLNGIYSKEFSQIGSLPKGVLLQNLSTAIEKNGAQLQPYLKDPLKEEKNPFAAINIFSFQDGVFLSVPADTVIEDPIQLLFAGVDGAGAISDYPRIVLSIGAGAKVDLLFDSVGLTDTDRFTNSLVEIHLERNARLNLIHLQREQEKAYQFFTARCHLQEGSHLDVVTYSRGGEILRNEMIVDFEGENAFANLRFLSVLSEKSKNFNFIEMNHRVPGCTSRQLSKNILSGKTQAEFNSVVSVFRNAQKSDTDQLSRNLLLSDSARAFSRPQLKIDADDVKCAHGAATGQLVGDELFYLRSRGIEKKQASFILTNSFADEVLETISLDEVRTSLEHEVHEELNKILEGVEPESIGVV